MPTGTVKWFNTTKGYGFIRPADGSKDVFIHVTAVQRAGITGLTEGQQLEYELTEGKDGRTAADNIKAVE